MINHRIILGNAVDDAVTFVPAHMPEGELVPEEGIDLRQQRFDEGVGRVHRWVQRVGPVHQTTDAGALLPALPLPAHQTTDARASNHRRTCIRQVLTADPGCRTGWTGWGIWKIRI